MAFHVLKLFLLQTTWNKQHLCWIQNLNKFIGVLSVVAALVYKINTIPMLCVCVFKYTCIYSLSSVSVAVVFCFKNAWMLLGAEPPFQPPHSTLRLPLGPCHTTAPMLRATCPQPPMITTKSTLQVHKNYPQDSEVAINCQINLELGASYIYLSMSY